VAHAEAHPNPNLHDDPSAQPLLFVTVVGVIIFLATVFFVAAAAWQFRQAAVDQVYTNVADTQVAQLHSQQMQNIHGAPRWLDRASGKVAIPVEQAMEIVRNELSAGGGAASKGP
jgi:hypothetical protein